MAAAPHPPADLCTKAPFQAICDARTKDPTIFKINPHHLILGPNTLGAGKAKSAGRPRRRLPVQPWKDA